MAISTVNKNLPKLPDGLSQRLNADRVTYSVSNNKHRGKFARKGGGMGGVGSYLTKTGGIKGNSLKIAVYNKRTVKKAKKWANGFKGGQFIDRFVIKRYGDFISKSKGAITSDFDKGVKILIKEMGDLVRNGK